MAVLFRGLVHWAGLTEPVAALLLLVLWCSATANADQGIHTGDDPARPEETVPERTAAGEAPDLYHQPADVRQVVYQEAPGAPATAPAPGPPAAVNDALSLFDLSIEQLSEQSVFRSEPMVTTVSRVEERISDSPGSVHSFSREMIQKRGFRSLRELLQVVPGFTVFHRDLQYVAGVRGLNANDNEKITLLINGQYFNGMNEPEYLNGPINLDNVERVEVVVGPSSFFQQANTLAATINVITRDVDGIEAVFSAGNDLPYSVTVMGGRRWADDDSISLSFTTEKRDGFDAWDSTFRPNLAGRDLTGELEQPNFFGILTRRYGEWSAQAIAFQTTSPELLITNGDPRNNGQFSDLICSVLLKNEHPYSDVLTRIVTASVSYKHQGRTNQGGPPVPETGLEQLLSQMQYFGEVGLRYTGLRRHLIQAGVQLEYEDNFRCYFNTVDRDPDTDVVTVYDHTPLIDRDTQAIGIYLDDEIQVTDRLKLIGGVRQDRNTLLPGDEWFTGIRSAIVFRTTERWVTKATFNRAVRMPSPLAALNAAWGIDKPSAPPWARLAPNATEPEILSTVELHNIFYLGDFRLGTVVYHEELDDFISWFGPHTNVGNFVGTGVELTLEGPLNACTTIWANTSYNDSRLLPFHQYAGGGEGMEHHHIITNQGGRIVGSPEWTANLGLDRQIGCNLTFSPTLRYFTEQAAFDYDSDTFMTIRNRFYLDATLTWRHFWGRNTDLSLSGYNLLDNRSPVAGQWLRDTYRPRGATFVASLQSRF